MQQKELASLLDISPAMVSRLAKQGMPTDTLERATRWRKRHLEPGRVKGSKMGTVKAIPLQPAYPSTPNQEPEAIEPTSYHAAKTLRESAEAQIAQLKLLEKQGHLIRIDAVEIVLARTFSTFRDNLLQMPSRLAALIAAESDPAKVHNMLYEEFHRALVELSGATDRLTTPSQGTE